MQVNETIKRQIRITAELDGVEREQPTLDSYREAIFWIAEACRIGCKITKVEVIH